jgi:hypothetical protein
MKPATFLSLVALSLAGSYACGTEPAELPTRFATSGTTVSLRLRDAAGPVVLRALGRNWIDPVTPKAGAIEVELPAVRVPITFSVVASDKTEPVLARVIVYPPQYRLKWDERVALVVDAGGPAWLQEWLAATGLPAKPVTLRDLPVGPDRDAGDGGLVIVGRAAAGKSSNEFIERHAQWQINVFVLEAEWFGEPANEEVRLGTGPDERFHHALVELNRYAWPHGVSFSGMAGPWPGIANRWVWIDGPSAPLVEEVRSSQSNRRIVFNYLPWRQQLGIETADAIFLSVLKEAARNTAAGEGLDRDFVLHWPPAEVVSAATRPVLAACLRERQTRRDAADSEPRSIPARAPLPILDLRGPALTANEAADLPVVSVDQDWLVLGSDPGVALPDPPPAKGSHESGAIKKPRLIHLEDDALPSSSRGRVRLMQVLTDQGISIGKIKVIRRDP